ncbi:MAG: fumarate reductase subunit C [Acidobacteria bacterium]|nr:MAG: fumarate reductase subunit C [Acidobacteriota bacterium]
MTPGSNYTLYHPRWYRKRVSVWWWLETRPYIFFVIRELTSLAVAYFAVVFLWMLKALADGPESYARFLARMQNPGLAAVNTLGFLMILFHAVTWFNLAPRAMAVRLAGKRLPDWAIRGANYGAWAVATALVVWLAERG